MYRPRVQVCCTTVVQKQGKPLTRSLMLSLTPYGTHHRPPRSPCISRPQLMDYSGKFSAFDVAVWGNCTNFLVRLPRFDKGGNTGRKETILRRTGGPCHAAEPGALPLSLPETLQILTPQPSKTPSGLQGLCHCVRWCCWRRCERGRLRSKGGHLQVARWPLPADRCGAAHRRTRRRRG